MVKTQEPAYYRLMVGDFDVTAISDGTVKLPMLKLLTTLFCAPEFVACGGVQHAQVVGCWVPTSHP
jgi:hypothetical protein